MDDHANRRLPIIAPMLLTTVLAWLAIARPGNLSGEPFHRALATLTAVAAVGCIAWGFHRSIVAGAAIVLLRVADPLNPSYEAILERGWDAIVLAILALGIGVASRQGRSSTTAWVILALVAVGIG